MKLIYLLILSLLIMVSCKESSNEEAAAEETEMVEEAVAEESEEPTENEAGFFGEEFDISSSVAYEEALANLGEGDSLEVKLHAPVNAVCQVKGCWMTMGDTTNAIRVKFKDYGFFVPMDCSGKTAYVNGVMKREIVTVDEQKHYLEDAGAEQTEIDAIVADKEKLTFLASGVKISE